LGGLEHTWRLAEHKEEHRWLIAGLWSEQAVCIVGGKPECCKSFLALDTRRRSPPAMLRVGSTAPITIKSASVARREPY
jgi:hypothetical protein